MKGTPRPENARGSGHVNGRVGRYHHHHLIQPSFKEQGQVCFIFLFVFSWAASYDVEKKSRTRGTLHPWALSFHHKDLVYLSSQIFLSSPLLSPSVQLSLSFFHYHKGDENSLISWDSHLTGNYLTAGGYPVTASVEERQQRLREWNLPPSITVPGATLQEGLMLLRHYEEVSGTAMGYVWQSLASLWLLEGDKYLFVSVWSNK